MQGVCLVIKCHEAFAAGGTMHPQVPLHLVGVKDMQRAVEVIGEPIGHIHQKADRTQTDGAQLGLKPVWAGAVFHTLYQAPAKQRAAIQRIIVDRYADVSLEGGGNRIDRAGLQRAKTPRCKVTRHAPHAQRIGAVGGNRDLDHGINLLRCVRSQPVGKAVTYVAR